MHMFDLGTDTMVNIDNIDYVEFKDLEEQKTVVIGIKNRSFIVPISKHREFFELLMHMGTTPTKQFVSM